MAGSVNKVILVGNLGRDPETRMMQNGGKVVNLTVATSVSWKDRNTNERQERTEWHRVVIFNERLADVAERFLRKGSTVYIEGELRTRKWTDQQGMERYTTEVVIDRFRGELTMLGSRNNGGDYGGGGDYEGGYNEGGNRSQSGSSFGGGQGGSPSQGGCSNSQPGGQGGGWDAPADHDLDDEIPF